MRTGQWDGGGRNFGLDYESKPFFENRTQREWLSTEEAAYFLSISPNALRIMVHRDQIRAFQKKGDGQNLPVSIVPAGFKPEDFLCTT